MLIICGCHKSMWPSMLSLLNSGFFCFRWAKSPIVLSPVAVDGLCCWNLLLPRPVTRLCCRRSASVIWCQFSEWNTIGIRHDTPVYWQSDCSSFGLQITLAFSGTKTVATTLEFWNREQAAFDWTKGEYTQHGPLTLLRWDYYSQVKNWAHISSAWTLTSRGDLHS